MDRYQCTRDRDKQKTWTHPNITLDGILVTL
jgi:hypothetical protein